MKDENTHIEVLIIEDEVDICFLLTGILRKKNLHTTFVNTIKDGKTSLGRIQPSLLLLDNNLPDGSGIDFIGEIKSINPDIKIILITADDTLDNKHKALKAGADYFIGKPFTRNTIDQTLDSALELVHY